MKKYITKILCLLILFHAQIKANEFKENSYSFNYNSDNVRNFDLGIQLKYLSGFGLTGNVIVNDQFYMTGSASWLFSIFDLSIGSGFKVIKDLSLFLKLNVIFIDQQSNWQDLIFPEAGLRIPIFKNLNVELGTIIPFDEENRKILKSYINVPFIVNAGVIIYILDK